MTLCLMVWMGLAGLWNSLNDPVFDGMDGTGRFIEQPE